MSKSSVAVREPCHSACSNSVSITKNFTKAASEAFVSQESSFVWQVTSCQMATEVTPEDHNGHQQSYKNSKGGLKATSD